MRALIVEAGWTTAALAGVRALAAAGWDVGVASPVRGCAASSRYCARWHTVVSPADGLDLFATGIRRAVDNDGYEVIFPAGDAELLALSARRDDLGAQLPYAPHASLLRVIDKLTLCDVAKDAGLTVPRTTPADAANLAEVDGPVMVKSRLHHVPGAVGTPLRVPVRRANGRRQAAVFAGEISAAGGEPVLQEVVRGRLCALASMTDRDGRTVARVHHVCEQTFPADAGMTSRAYTSPVDGEFGAGVARLLATLRWFGLAQIQYLRTDDGRAAMIDFNGRFYAPMAIALAADVNLPGAWAALATGRPFAVPAEARPGVRYQWLEGDLRAPFVPGGDRTVRRVMSTLLAAPRSHHAVWDRSDPRPAWRSATRLGGILFRR